MLINGSDLNSSFKSKGIKSKVSPEVKNRFADIDHEQKVQILKKIIQGKQTVGLRKKEQSKEGGAILDKTPSGEKNKNKFDNLVEE